MSVPPSADFVATGLPCERYGLQLVGEAPVAVPRANAPGAVRRLCLFDWGLLAGFATLQIAYLAGLAVLARWALRQLIGA